MLLIGRDERRLREVQEEADGAGRKAGGRAATLTCDVTEGSSGERILATAGEYFGQLDVLVNNAGFASWRDLDDVPEAVREVMHFHPVKDVREVLALALT